MRAKRNSRRFAVRRLCQTIFSQTTNVRYAPKGSMNPFLSLLAVFVLIFLKTRNDAFPGNRVIRKINTLNVYRSITSDK